MSMQLQLGNIPLLQIRPLLDIMEIHDLVGTTVSAQRVPPVPVDGALGIPLDDFMDAG